MSGLVEGKVAIVTGSSTGIGRGIAQVLAREGADVVVNCRTDTDAAARTAQQIEQAGRRALVVQADVGVANDVERLFDRTLESFGGLDILVNNAGIMPRRDFLETDETFFDAMFATDVKGVFFCSHRAAHIMKTRKSGRIVNISSIHDTKSSHEFSVYAAAKAAVSQLTLGMAIDLGEHGITVNAISPGWVPTEREGECPEELFKTFCARVPVGRPGTPEDVGELTAFLASDRASWLTGQVIHLDGGHSCMINMPSRRRDKDIYGL